MKIVNVDEARGQLSKLLDEAEAGEEIGIARNGKPVVRLVPVTAPARSLGRFRDKVPPVSDAQWTDAVSAMFAGALQ